MESCILSVLVIRMALRSLNGSLRNALGAVDVEGAGAIVVDIGLGVGSTMTGRLEAELEETFSTLLLDEEEDPDVTELRVAVVEEDDVRDTDELTPLLERLEEVETDELFDELEPDVVVELKDEVLVELKDEALVEDLVELIDDEVVEEVLTVEVLEDKVSLEVLVEVFVELAVDVLDELVDEVLDWLTDDDTFVELELDALDEAVPELALDETALELVLDEPAEAEAEEAELTLLIVDVLAAELDTMGTKIAALAVELALLDGTWFVLDDFAIEEEPLEPEHVPKGD
jgi:hypothetical protein